MDLRPISTPPTDDASSSNTTLRERRTRSLSVRTTIPASALREHEGTNVRAPSSSTTHTRHTLTGVRFAAQHMVGVSMLSALHASRRVAPSGTRTARQSTATTVCPYCGVGCAVTLHVQDDRVVKVTSPVESTVTNGQLCVKGRFGWQYVNSGR